MDSELLHELSLELWLRKCYFLYDFTSRNLFCLLIFNFVADCKGTLTQFAENFVVNDFSRSILVLLYLLYQCIFLFSQMFHF